MKVLIVGSGIAGASAAYYLAKQNIEVVIADKEHPGKATSAGAGIVCPWGPSERGKDWYELAKRGAAFYPSLIADLQKEGEMEFGYKKTGALYVSSIREELDRVQNELESNKKEAPEVGEISRLNNQEARKQFPPLNDTVEAVFVSGGARVDGRLLQKALLRAAQKHGAKLISGEAVLLREGNRITGGSVNGEAILADAVLVAAGAWAPALLEPLGIRLNVEPQRGQIVHIKLTGEDTADWPVIIPESSHYMLAFDDSRVVAGATRETGSGFDYRKTAGGIHEVLSEALKVAPGLSAGVLEDIRIGFRPMGPDALPLLGEVEPYKGLVLATGLGPSGLAMGPYIGKLAADIATGKPVDIDLELYNPLR
ncbi:FAD-binding oxidoreductase [Planomicrobium sp. CPCC 101079]|uniref:NAD(P)/FAD-dependent oxidoreductase n=1 Tax=Planomicrobium sp. CPCC 101079 TaxID=2599618 RepID=UPI0011B69017|nr:FAD-dependent oxidoreductase [Planomicrobium sp. CPCC 101079]TWT01441.1 FAD-binding oxidoreductase [Planomicrobium sp. CPCC 101079]